tara:strand:- start:81 stop:647 length:567 start_codon:yes stop_codon:yes gene_type:complete
MIKLGVLGSTKGTDLEPIVNAINQNTLKAKVSVIISNNSKAYILNRAKSYNIPSYFISTKNKSRINFDSEITEVLTKYNVDLILLIGFMRILSSSFCKRWNKKIINVHPSLLPKYAGGMDTNVHEEVIKNQDTVTGCTIHLVTENIDKGPILIQKKCKVKNSDSVNSLKKRVQKLEGEAFIEVIKMLS